MGFFDKIKATFSAGDDTACMEKPSASEYVDWLPRYVMRKSWTEVTIDTSCPLPGSDEAPCVPDHAAVLNRLKILCGLNPFRFPEPVDGNFERHLANHTIRISARFSDQDVGSTCRLRLTIHV